MEAGRTYPCDLGRAPNPERVRELVANTSTPDRHGTIYPPRGGNFANFQRNPAVTWMHAEMQAQSRKVEPDELIGMAAYLRLEPGPTPADDRLICGIEFEENNPIAQRCLEKFDAGSLRAASITAKPGKTHQENQITVADDWELWAISLCILGSNPDALALRAAIEGRTMNEELFKALGCENGADFDTCLQALINKLADTPEKMQMALGVMSMKAMGSGGAAPAAPVQDAAPADPAAPAEPGSDPDQKAAGCEDKQPPEMRAAKLVIAALQADNKALQAAQRSVQAKTSEQYADEQIKAGHWPAAARQALIDEHSKSPDVAQRSVVMLAGHNFTPRQASLTALAPGLNAAQRAAAPNFGAGPVRAPDQDAEAKKRTAAAVSEIRAKATQHTGGGIKRAPMPAVRS